MQNRKARLFSATLALILGCLVLGPRPAAALNGALLLVEVDSGKVLHAENATFPWYPASVTKLMTAYVTLRAVKDGRIKLDTLFTVSDNAMAQQPSKMGFKTGTKVTVDNALKMLMVKSANDIAVVLAEGVSGSIEKFADEMNRTSQRLGMTQSSWVNPNGLPADEQITSARDMAILARTILRDFPEYDFYWRVPAIRFGRKVMRNTNFLIDRYPGADGMKTGFICASGFNVVASATRNGKRLIAVVMGAPSSPVRAERAANLFEKGFNGGGLSWLMPSLGAVENLAPIAAAPPNLREDMCGKHRKRPASEAEEEDPVVASHADPSSAYAAVMPSLRGRNERTGPLIGPLIASMEPIPVYVGLPKSGPQLASEKSQRVRKPANGKTAKSKTDKASAAAAKEAKPAAAKPAAAAAKEAKPAAAKPAATVVNETKPATAAKPAAAAVKPAPKSVGTSASAAASGQAAVGAKASASAKITAAPNDVKPAAAKDAKPAPKPATKPARKPANAKQAATSQAPKPNP